MYCGFCCRTQYEALVLITGAVPGSNICEQCIDLCAEIVAEKRAAKFADVQRLSEILGATHL